MGALGFFLYGPQSLLGLTSMEIVPPHMAALASSSVSVCSQVGGAIAGQGCELIPFSSGGRLAGGVPSVAGKGAIWVGRVRLPAHWWWDTACGAARSAVGYAAGRCASGEEEGGIIKFVGFDCCSCKARLLQRIGEEISKKICGTT